MSKLTKKRTEGWGNLINAAKAHYFVDGRSLCKKWACFTEPRWETNQELGSGPDKGTCAVCWRACAALAAKRRGR